MADGQIVLDSADSGNANDGIASKDGLVIAGSLVHIQDSAGADILTFAPGKAYQSIAISSPDLSQGATYTVTSDGWYPDGGASGGSDYATFPRADLVTQVGTRASRMR